MLKDIKTRTFIIISVLIIILDQAAKRWIVSMLGQNESLLPDNPILNIILTFNTGAGFGILKDWTAALGIISFIVALGIVVFYRHIRNEDRVFVSLVLGGTIGNLIDRIFIGHVIDFISVKFFPPVFNIADSAITIGVLGLIINLIRKDLEVRIIGKDKNKEKAKEKR